MKKLFLFFFSFLIVVFTGSFLLLAYIQKPLTDYALEQINNNTLTDIQVKVIDVSLWNTFPYVGLELENILIHSVINKKETKDTLLFADEVVLKFNILDLLKKKYNVKKIDIHSGKISVEIDKTGKNNYTFWKEKKDSSQVDFMVNLDQVTLSDIQMHFVDFGKNMRYLGVLRQSKIQGSFSSQNYTLSLKTILEENSIQSKEFTNEYFKLIESELVINMDFESENHTVEVGKLLVNSNLNFELSGTIQSQKENLLLDISINAKQLKVEEIIAFAPQYMQDSISLYAPKGFLTLEATVKGSMSNRSLPNVEAILSVTQASVLIPTINAAVTDISFSGNVTLQDNYTSFTFSSESLKGLFAEQPFMGELQCNYKNQLYLSGKLQTDADLHAITQTIPIDFLEKLSGNAKASLRFSGQLDAITATTALNQLNFFGDITLTRVLVKPKNQTYEIEEINGKIMLNNSSFEIHQLEGKVKDSDFKIDGNIKNVISYFLNQDETVEINLEIASNRLDLNGFSNTDETKSTWIAFPKNAIIRINSSIASLQYNRMLLENLHSTLVITSDFISASNTSFQGMNGQITLEAEALRKKDGTDIRIHSIIEKIDIDKLFYQFENFGQTVILDSHLRGKTSADIVLKLSIDTLGTIREESIKSLVNITIEKGELIGFEPFKEITKQIREKRLYAKFIDVESLEKKLNHIYFSTLNNQLEIDNKTITVPFMNISSSALDVELAGKHTFDNEIDYQVNFYLSDILTQKAEKQESDLWEVRSDGKKKYKTFYSILGTVDEFDVKQNKSEYKEQVKKEIKTEKNTLKSLLKEEFNLFSKDTSVKTMSAPSQKPMNNIEWEENKTSKPTNATNAQKPTDSKPKKGLKGLINLEENKEETEFFNPK